MAQSWPWDSQIAVKKKKILQKEQGQSLGASFHFRFLMLVILFLIKVGIKKTILFREKNFIIIFNFNVKRRSLKTSQIILQIFVLSSFDLTHLTLDRHTDRYPLHWLFQRHHISEKTFRDKWKFDKFLARGFNWFAIHESRTLNSNSAYYPVLIQSCVKLLVLSSS